MAARRIFSFIADRHLKNPKIRESVLDFRTPTSSVYRNYETYIRRCQTLSEGNNKDTEKPNESCGPKLDPGTSESLSSSTDAKTNINHSVISKLKISERHDRVMIFTCKVCDTRSIKTVCRESYEKGVVVARCEGCNNLHLIADRLGWFGEPGSVEDFLAARGEEVKKGSMDTFNLTLEDLAGKKSIDG